MQFYILGASIFFFSASLALNFGSYKILHRAIEVLRFSIELQERSDILRKEGTD